MPRARDYRMREPHYAHPIGARQRDKERHIWKTKCYQLTMLPAMGIPPGQLCLQPSLVQLRHQLPVQASDRLDTALPSLAILHDGHSGKRARPFASLDVRPRRRRLSRNPLEADGWLKQPVPSAELVGQTGGTQV